MADSETLRLAELFLSEVRSSLVRGTKHFDKNGNLLATEREILEALLRDGELAFVPETTTYPAAYCSCCSRRLTPKKDGTAPEHNRSWSKIDRRKTWCEGSGAYMDSKPNPSGVNC